jgi:hypothetical protein
MKIHLLVLEFMALYIRGVQLVSLIVGSPNKCFVNKVDELNESVPMDMDRVVVVKARDDMEIDNDLQDIIEIHNDPMEAE